MDNDVPHDKTKGFDEGVPNGVKPWWFAEVSSIHRRHIWLCVVLIGSAAALTRLFPAGILENRTQEGIGGILSSVTDMGYSYSKPVTAGLLPIVLLIAFFLQFDRALLPMQCVAFYVMRPAVYLVAATAFLTVVLHGVTWCFIQPVICIPLWGVFLYAMYRVAQYLQRHPLSEQAGGLLNLLSEQNASWGLFTASACLMFYILYITGFWG